MPVSTRSYLLEFWVDLVLEGKDALRGVCNLGLVFDRSELEVAAGFRIGPRAYVGGWVCMVVGSEVGKGVGIVVGIVVGVGSFGVGVGTAATEWALEVVCVEAPRVARILVEIELVVAVDGPLVYLLVDP